MHWTFWKADSALKSFLLEIPLSGKHPAEMNNYIKQVVKRLNDAQTEEPWLQSGWALQEGILLNKAILADVNGSTLKSELFSHQHGATFADLTTKVTSLAVKLARAFLVHSEGQSPKGQLESLFTNVQSIREMRIALRDLVSSGLVTFPNQSPLFFLASKDKRHFSIPQDRYWGLIGAMAIDDIAISYDQPILEIKRRLLKTLIEKYQWRIFMLPSLEKGQKTLDWLDITEGVFIPLELFTCSQIASSGPSNLPLLKFENDVKIIPHPGQKKISVFRSVKTSWFRQYCQRDDGIHILSPSVSDNRPYIGDLAFLVLEDLESKGTIHGKRCMAMKDFYIPQNKPAYGVFGGIIDIWMDEFEKQEIEELLLDSKLF